MQIPKSVVQEIIDRASREDLGWGDITTAALIPQCQAKGSVLVKKAGVLAGIHILEQVFRSVDENIQVEVLMGDGAKVGPGDVVAIVRGSAASILSAERVALNFLQRLSGIATLTSRYVEAVKGLPVRIADTRKTTPGLRILEKYAVRVGGGVNHRQSLSDGVIIKDNHLTILRSSGHSMKEIVTKARDNVPHTVKIEVEVETVEEAVAAVEAGADVLMLDNMSLEEMQRAVQAVTGRALLEASGGVTLENVRQIAETGVDIISSGALTHSVKALDISVELKRDVVQMKGGELWHRRQGSLPQRS